MHINYYFNEETGESAVILKPPEAHLVHHQIKAVLNNNLPEISPLLLSKLAIVLELGMVNLYYTSGRYVGELEQYWDGIPVYDQLANILQEKIPYISSHDLARTSLALQLYLMELHEKMEQEHVERD